MAIKLLMVVALSGLAVNADDAEAIRAALRGFNKAIGKAEPRPLRALFTSDADFRDVTQVLKGPDALVSLLVNRQAWSERTPPMLQEQFIRLAGPLLWTRSSFSMAPRLESWPFPWCSCSKKKGTRGRSHPGEWPPA